MELGHGSEVLRQHFTVASLQRLNKVICSFFGSVLDVFQLHGFSLSAVSGLFCSSQERQRDKTSRKG
jgi:hypothetical protein